MQPSFLPGWGASFTGSGCTLTPPLSSPPPPPRGGNRHYLVVAKNVSLSYCIELRNCETSLSELMCTSFVLTLRLLLICMSAWHHQHLCMSACIPDPWVTYSKQLSGHEFCMLCASKWLVGSGVRSPPSSLGGEQGGVRV